MKLFFGLPLTDKHYVLNELFHISMKVLLHGLKFHFVVEMRRRALDNNAAMEHVCIQS